MWLPLSSKMHLLLLVCGAWACGTSQGTSTESTDTDTPAPDADSDLPPADSACGADCDLKPGTVRTTAGLVQGADESGTWAYTGIPYATAPIGDLRFQPPQAPAPWPDVRQATRFGPKCVQRDTDTGEIVGSEDCLFLNVWASDGLHDAPVLVFIHGGGNMTGSAIETVQDTSILLYGGQTLAARGGVVVVTLQYRLNIFGYMVQPALDAESARGTSGNYGLLDQLQALAWVQANIAAFGGDPSRVLLFGESGGASDVCALVSSPRAAGLFSAALMESAGDCKGHARQDVAAWSSGIVRTVGCDTAADPLACVRALDAATLAAAVVQPAVDSNGKVVDVIGPTIDGDVLVDDPIAVIARGAHQHVPLAVGVNADETSSPIFHIPNQVTTSDYASRVRASFPTIADSILAHYPASAFQSPRDALVAVTTDMQFICPARTIARAAAASQSEPVFRYLYTQVLDNPLNHFLGSPHGWELNFVFQNLEQTSYAMNDGDRALERGILDYWTRFAAAGDPNGDGNVIWPAYDVATDPYVALGTPIAAAAGVRADACDFWDSLTP